MRRDIEGRTRRGLRKGNRAMRAGALPTAWPWPRSGDEIPSADKAEHQGGIGSESEQGIQRRTPTPNFTPILDRAPTSLSANLGADAMFYAASGSSPAGGRSL
jgi:hypothetical protein